MTKSAPPRTPVPYTRRSLTPLLLVAATAMIAAFTHRTPEDRAAVPRAAANDNRVAAGTVVRDTLRVRLVAMNARWYPEADSGPSVETIAIAEEGKAPQIPAPMIRVPEGTVVDLTFRNALADSTVGIAGLHTRPADSGDTLNVAPGATRHLTFVAGTRGTYFYSLSAGQFKSRGVDGERETAAGAFIVDPRGQQPNDRVLVINIWGDQKDSLTYANALAINGRSWPHSERLAATVGDTMRWRVINASGRVHPMHLHGFYFTVGASGDVRRDTVYSPAARRLAVTENFRPFTTRDLTIVPDRPGNWLYHCHLGYHVIPGAAQLDQNPTHAAHNTMSSDASLHMAGLIMGIKISLPRGVKERKERASRTLSLWVNEGTQRDAAPRSMRFVLQRDAYVPRPDSLEPVSSPLILTRGQATDVVVHNQLKDATAVHWHGLELESFSDGVAGWSGNGTHVASMIAPADSFVAHLSVPRAGTFIYHTHLGDLEQLSSGLYGALVVIEPGRPFDPASDHIFVAGSDGTDSPERMLLNGSAEPAPLALAAGRTHRMRLVGIGLVSGGIYTLRRDTVVQRWRAIAKDGADLPAAQAVLRKAQLLLMAGETYDFAWTPDPGEYVMAVTMDAKRPPVRQKIIVR